jgi:hypothetical protein
MVAAEFDLIEKMVLAPGLLPISLITSSYNPLESILAFSLAILNDALLVSLFFCSSHAKR